MRDSRVAEGKRKALFLGLDLGGTELKAGLGRGGHDLVWERRIRHEETQRTAVVDALLRLAREGKDVAERAGLSLGGIGVGSPGIVDPKTGGICDAPANLPEWKDLNVREMLEERFRVPVIVENDANLAVYAEARVGSRDGKPAPQEAGQEHETIVMVTVGTGLGGGAMVNGELLRGTRGAGMEIGHIPWVHGGRPCTCSKNGCLEAYAGGWAMRRVWQEALVRAAIDRWSGILVAGLSLADLLRAARQRERLALRALSEGAQALGEGLVTALHLLNPAVLVIGGGIAAGRPRFVEEVEGHLRSRALPRVLAGLVVRRARFGNTAGVRGAVESVREIAG